MRQPPPGKVRRQAARAPRFPIPRYPRVGNLRTPADATLSFHPIGKAALAQSLSLDGMDFSSPVFLAALVSYAARCESSRGRLKTGNSVPCAAVFGGR